MKKAKRFLTGLLSAALALSLCAMPAMADEGTVDTSTPQKSTSVIDTTKKGSITIYKYNTTEQTAQGATGTGEIQTPPDGATPLRGAEFTIYQVKDADWLQTYYGGGALAKGEKAPEVDDYFNKENGVVKSYEASNLVTGIADKAKGTQTTDDDGFAQFKNLDLGLYLVIETKKPQSVVTAVTPFLVSVPMTRVQTGDQATNGQLQEWLYDIVVYPKNSTVKGTFYLEKKGVIGNDKDHSTALPGVKFQLERLNDGVELENATDEDWTLILPPKKQDEEQKNYFVTGANGKIQVDNLTPGTYRFTEIGYDENQDEKYIVNAGDRYVFVVNPDGATVAKPMNENNNNDNDYVTNGDTVTVYNYVPDVNKQVQKRGDENTWQEAADYNVGDMVPYKVTVTVPENITRLKTFTVTDTPTNLEDDVSTIKVLYINGETTTELNGTAAIKAINKVDKGFEIQFDPAAMSDYAGKEIVITYQAKLLSDAVSTTDGNSNKVSLIYSNKVKTDDVPDAEKDKKTVQDETVVYTFKIKITKTDEKGNGLNGVEFDLYKEVTAGTANAITGNEAKAKGLDETKCWLKVNELPLTTKKVDGVDGILEVKGLANGTYKLVETKTLKDYNLLKEPVDVTLDIAYKTTWTETNHYENGVWVKREVTKKNENFDSEEGTNGGTQNGKDGDGVTSTTIINRKGFNLPTTGGFGTLLFSGIGVLLVVAGVGVLLSLKKKNRA
ncbi:SpaH/EbpB family LPXTG-anchored major pilin [Gemmiger sp.]|uniref:SpaH/EbpB family LPXTG-anchored major pilin n=1 Tax=Gemmiger sp. TaxID=2049027 RepID=UPI0025C4FC6B|nr:SpaH/EbpB family LPXTG-anchored major pilin [Gemmiger sp.]